LAAVLRTRLLSKVRVLEVWCKSGKHRCMQVLTIDKRPLALGYRSSLHSTIVIGGTSRTGLRHLDGLRAVWLDDAPPAVFIDADCRCGHQTVPAGWLRDQIDAGRRRRVLDSLARGEIRAARLREFPPL
jgi:hypothetical protein